VNWVDEQGRSEGQDGGGEERKSGKFGREGDRPDTTQEHDSKQERVHKVSIRPDDVSEQRWRANVRVD
jgi:hypothetical protein